jgi:hypothetical protein
MNIEREFLTRVVFRAGFAVILAVEGTFAAIAGPLVELPGPRAFPESITSIADGTRYVSSLASGGVLRIRPGATEAEPWIEPGAYDTRSTFGVLADEASNTLWLCSNDASALGVPGPNSIKGSFLKGFDLKTGAGKFSAALPGEHTLCNDIAIGPDRSLYVTNTFAPEILRLPPGGERLEVWLTNPQFEPPKNGGGLDGIAFGSDGNIYVNTYTLGDLFQVDLKSGTPVSVVKLKTSRPLDQPDGLRPYDGKGFLMIEGGGSLDHVTVSGDSAAIETIQDGFLHPTGVTLDGNTAWVTEGQLSSLAYPSSGSAPRLPFRVYAVPLEQR